MTNPKMKKLKMTLQITNKKYTGYFTNDNKPDGKCNPQYICKANLASRLSVQIYYGLHFQSVGLIITREVSCMYIKRQITLTPFFFWFSSVVNFISLFLKTISYLY
jgi:hypothetical protein